MLTDTGEFWTTVPRGTPQNTSVLGQQEVLSPHGQSSSSIWDVDKFTGFVGEATSSWAEKTLFRGRAYAAC